MKTTVIWFLVALNAMLLGALVWKYLPTNYAEAQVRRPGDYVMIPVDFPGARAGTVVILDSTTREMSAIMFDDTQKTIGAMPPIKLDDVFAGGRRR
jgi:TRAP-type uncharacterized transport system fused permease subunit